MSTEVLQTNEELYDIFKLEIQNEWSQQLAEIWYIEEGIEHKNALVQILMDFEKILKSSRFGRYQQNYWYVWMGGFYLRYIFDDIK